MASVSLSTLPAASYVQDLVAQVGIVVTSLACEVMFPEASYE